MLCWCWLLIVACWLLIVDVDVDVDVMSCHVMSCHVMSCHVMLCYVMLCYVMLFDEWSMLCKIRFRCPFSVVKTTKWQGGGAPAAGAGESAVDHDLNFSLFKWSWNFTYCKNNSWFLSWNSLWQGKIIQDFFLKCNVYIQLYLNL